MILEMMSLHLEAFPRKLELKATSSSTCNINIFVLRVVLTYWKGERKTLMFKRERKNSVNNLYFIEMKETTIYRRGACMF